MKTKAAIRAMPHKFPAVAAAAATVVRGFLDDVTIANAPAKKRRGRPHRVPLSIPSLEKPKRGRKIKWTDEKLQQLQDNVSRYKLDHPGATDSEALAAMLDIRLTARHNPQIKSLRNVLSMARRRYPENLS